MLVETTTPGLLFLLHFLDFIFILVSIAVCIHKWHLNKLAFFCIASFTCDTFVDLKYGNFGFQLSDWLILYYPMIIATVYSMSFNFCFPSYMR